MNTKRGLKIVSFILVVCMLVHSIAVMDTKAAYGTIVTITETGQVVDTFNGVNSVYRPNYTTDGTDSTYGCHAYVIKYYQAIYGETVYNLFHKQTPLTYSGKQFVVTTTPQAGDICAQIKTSTNHWSIVKSVSGTTVTVIDQNNKWTTTANGASVTQAYKDYTYDFSEVTFYHLQDAAAVTEATTTEATTTQAAATTTAVTSAGQLPVGNTFVIYRNRKLALNSSNVAVLATDPAVKWKSSKKKVAKVSRVGVVKGIKKGNSRITATLASGAQTSVNVKVVTPATKLKLASKDVTLPKNDSSWTLTATMKPRGCNDVKTYSSSDTSIATVDASGRITTYDKRGSTNITVRTSSGKKKKCIVRVY